MRKHYLDNIRWITVVLVMLYHLFFVFNACGVPAGIGSFKKVQYQDVLLPAVYPWFMVLLFVVAGMSARYALEKYSGKEFFRARTRKLLVPSTIGLLVFQWITGWFNMLNSNALDESLQPLPLLVKYFIAALSGTGPLWFAQTLWLFTPLLLLIRRIDKNDRLGKLGAKANIPVLILLFLPMWGASFMLNTPVIAVYRFGIYGLGFLLGYEVFAHEGVQQRVEKMAVPMLAAAVVGCIAYVWYYFGKDNTTDKVLHSAFTNAYMWCAVLAFIGCGRKWLNFSNKFTDLMSKNSFGYYVLHYLPTAAVGYLTYNAAKMPAVLCYLLTGIAIFAGTPLLYEVIRRIPFVRWCVLGIKTPHEKKA